MSQFVLRLHIRAYPLEFPSFEIPVDQYSEKLSPLGNFVYQKLPVKLCLNTVVGTYVNNVVHQFDIKIEKLYITRRPPPGTVRPRTDGPGKKVKIGQFVRISTGDW